MFIALTIFSNFTPNCNGYPHLHVYKIRVIHCYYIYTMLLLDVFKENREEEYEWEKLNLKNLD